MHAENGPYIAATRIQRPMATALLAWLAMLGVDLLLHGGVLAPVYDWDSPFLLSPQDAFIRIPAGYAAFGVLAAAMVWLLPRLGVRSAGHAARVAAIGGAILWGTLLLGMWSITTAEPPLLLAWWAGETVQLAVGGYVIGLVMQGARIRNVGWLVLGLVIMGAAVAITLQSIGYAPAPVTIN